MRYVTVGLILDISWQCQSSQNILIIEPAFLENIAGKDLRLYAYARAETDNNVDAQPWFWYEGRLAVS